LAFVGVPALFIMAAIVLSVMYPITDARAIEVRAILDARKKDKDSGEPVLAGATETEGV